MLYLQSTTHIYNEIYRVSRDNCKKVKLLYAPKEEFRVPIFKLEVGQFLMVTVTFFILVTAKKI